MEQPKVTSLHLSIVLLGAVTLIVFFILNFFNISFPISITTTATSGELSVVGEGKVDVVPDIAEVSAGITVNNVKTADEAERKISETNNKIIDAITALGIQKEDIKTSSYSVNPDYTYEPLGGRNTPSGYSGNATVTIKVKDANKVGQVITAATGAGATNVNNNGFTVDDPAKYREEARNKAIENAKEQAQKLASQLGIRLGQVTNIVESSDGGYPLPMYGKEDQVLRVGGGVPPEIEPGTQTVTSTVTLFFERR